MFNQILFNQYGNMAVNGRDTFTCQLGYTFALKSGIAIYYQESSLYAFI